MSSTVEAGTDAAVLHDDLRLLLRFLSEYFAPRSRYLRTYGQPFAFSLDGSGNGVYDLGSPPAGHLWKLELLCFHTASGTPSFGIFVGPQSTTDPVFRRSFQPAITGPPSSADSTLSQWPPIHAGVGEHVTLQMQGGATNGACSGSVQIRLEQVQQPALVAG